MLENVPIEIRNLKYSKVEDADIMVIYIVNLTYN